ncbi:MAG: hypothetical protein ABJE80_18300 [Reichenbachiella sp.]|uniref:hypothetical protein n=1 Tax=Reichenbachiella sp. TaxID=2184521 RepID=UPI003262DBCB
MKKLIIPMMFSVLFVLGSKAQTISNEDTNIDLSTADIWVVEKTLNTEKLKKYFHFELMERLPLMVLFKGNVEESFEISCFGHSVNIITSLDAGGNDGSIIELVNLTRNENEIILVFKYSIEGIKVTSVFNKKGQEWEMKELEIIEN